MKLTIEIGNLNEAEQILLFFKSIPFESVRLVVDSPKPKTVAKQAVLSKINRPMAKKLDLEALKKAKNYKGVNRARFNQLVKEINIHEPIELLLSQLSK